MKTILLEKSLPYVMGAVLEPSGRLTDAFFDLHDDALSVGSIFKGRVIDLFEEHGYAFVDIGTDQKAYLPLSKVDRNTRLKRGTDCLVQIEKTPHLGKGAVVSARLEYSGPHLILTQFFKGFRLSSTIEKSVGIAIKRLLSGKFPEDYGLMVRTAALEADEETLLEELKQLSELQKKCTRDLTLKPIGCFHTAKSSLEDWAIQYVVEPVIIKANSAFLETFPLIKDVFGTALDPASLKVGSVFQEAQLDNLWLKLSERSAAVWGGAELVIDEAEAFTFIDVNSGGYVHQNQSSSLALTVNLWACEEIARQIRLRNLAGALLIDFIKMPSEDERLQVIAALENALEDYRASIRIYGFSALGILELTIRRRRPSVQQLVRHQTRVPIAPGYALYQLHRELLRLKGHLSSTSIGVKIAEELYPWAVKHQKELSEAAGMTLNLELDLSLKEGYRVVLTDSR